MVSWQASQLPATAGALLEYLKSDAYREAQKALWARVRSSYEVSRHVHQLRSHVLCKLLTRATFTDCSPIVIVAWVDGFDSASIFDRFFGRCRSLFASPGASCPPLISGINQ